MHILADVILLQLHGQELISQAAGLSQEGSLPLSMHRMACHPSVPLRQSICHLPTSLKPGLTFIKLVFTFSLSISCSQVVCLKPRQQSLHHTDSEIWVPINTMASQLNHERGLSPAHPFALTEFGAHQLCQHCSRSPALQAEELLVGAAAGTAIAELLAQRGQALERCAIAQSPVGYDAALT